MKYILMLLTILTINPAFGGEEMPTAAEVIKLLDLKPLPEEGGYYRETYRSDYGNNPAKLFGIDADSNRTMSTAIYYLVSTTSFSAIHRIKSDEIFHFYAGDPVEMIQIDENGNLQTITLGSDIFSGHQPQVVVKRGDWQALRLAPGGEWALMGTTVAPGFEFEDFEVGTREEMIQAFPQHRENIIRFTRESDEEAH